MIITADFLGEPLEFEPLTIDPHAESGIFREDVWRTDNRVAMKESEVGLRLVQSTLGRNLQNATAASIAIPTHLGRAARGNFEKKEEF